MTISKKVRCTYVDTLECFIMCATIYTCKHFHPHILDNICLKPYCADRDPPVFDAKCIEVEEDDNTTKS